VGIAKEREYLQVPVGPGDCRRVLWVIVVPSGIGPCQDALPGDVCQISATCPVSALANTIRRPSFAVATAGSPV
jgi:hypothetical protein